MEPAEVIVPAVNFVFSLIGCGILLKMWLDLRYLKSIVEENERRVSFGDPIMKPAPTTMPFGVFSPLVATAPAYSGKTVYPKKKAYPKPSNLTSPIYIDDAAAWQIERDQKAARDHHATYDFGSDSGSSYSNDCSSADSGSSCASD